MKRRAASLGTAAAANCTTLASFLSAFPSPKPQLAFCSAIATSSDKIRNHQHQIGTSSGNVLQFLSGLKGRIDSIDNLDDALSLYQQMVRMRPLSGT